MSAFSLPGLVQGFFTERLLRQLRASPNTIAAYRDTFRLLLQFAVKRRGVKVSALTPEHFDAGLITDFLEHLEKDRGNSPRTRNARLAAVRSFFRYVAIRDPARMHLATRIVAIPDKRHDRRPVTYLERQEAAALVAAADRSTRLGRRDRTLLFVAIQCGLSVSELVQLRRGDFVAGPGAHLRCSGKGRKERCTPLRKETEQLLLAWLSESAGEENDPIFTTTTGRALSRDAVQRLVAKYASLARVTCPSLTPKRVTPHVLRHTAAMDLLQSGVDRTVIALWLGHESVETTQIYLHSDLRMKEAALARTQGAGVKAGRYKPKDSLLTFLESL